MQKLILLSKKASKKTLPEKLEDLEAIYGQGNVEVWTTDEHRIGLQAILKTVWAPKGERPLVAVYPRYEWLYIYAFVHPASGRTEWFLMPRLSIEIFRIVLADFSKARNKHVLLVMDGASWHTSSKLLIPENVSLLKQPAYSPEVQPAEHLWKFTDEPLSNLCPDDMEELESILEKRCIELQKKPDLIRQATKFYWWPDV